VTVRGRVASALKWATVGQAFQRLFSWAVTLIVIRLLSPEDYGLMAISVVLINIAGILDDLGLNAALIQKRQLEAHVAPKIYAAVLLTSVLALLLVQAAAAPFAEFYDDHRIEPIARVLSFTLVLGAISSVPTALLLREIEFRTISLLEVGRTLLSSLLVLWLAWTGWGVWALVYGSLASSCLQALGILAITKFSLRPDFRIAGMGRELRFGTLVMATGFVSALNQNISTLLIGRLLGITPLGFFQVASDVAKMPVRALLRPAARVSFPTVARLQDDLARVGHFYLRMTGSLLLVLLPVCWGLAALSEEFVALVLGAKWTNAAPVLAVISLFVPLRVITRLMQSALDGIGRPEVGLLNLLTISLCVVPAIVIGVRWGIIGVAIAWCAGQFLALLVNIWRSLPALALSWRLLFGAVGPGILSAVLMYAGVWLVRPLLAETLSLPVLTGVLVSVGMLAYVSATLLLNRRVAMDAVRWMRSQTT
jgi:O-antigen/teichoic acid export membrane protein